MEIISGQKSIVVVAADHNPTILNPDFLIRQNIVDEGWGWNLSASPVTTPAFASVEYDSGISIIVDPNKLQVVDNTPAEPNDSKFTDIIKNYMGALPHVKYKAIGINFEVMIPTDESRNFMKEHFLNPKVKQEDELVTIGVRFVYQGEGYEKFVLNIDAGVKDPKFQDDNRPSNVIIAKGNFHRECSSEACAEDILGDFPDISKEWKVYKDRLEVLLG